MRRAALTLVEILAVCVLLGVIAVAIAPAVARRRPLAIDDFVTLLRAADGDVRVLARGQGARWEHRGFAIIAEIGPRRTDTIRVELPAGLSCTWTSGDRQIEALDIDRNGRSADLLVVVDDGREQRRLRCDGLVGLWRIDSPP